jgi:hypothetical protein
VEEPVSLPKRHRPGSQWRILAHTLASDGSYVGPIEDSSEKYPATEFDELVVDEWLHLEQMDSRIWSLRVGPLLITTTVGERGQAREVYVEDDQGDGWRAQQDHAGALIWERYR